MRLQDLIERNGTYWFEERANAKSEEERDHIIDHFELTMYHWKEYAIETLGWNDSQLSAILATPAKIIDTNGSPAVVSTNIIIIEDNPPIYNIDECECSQRSDYCSDNATCGSDECDVVKVGFLPTGCGTLLYYKCDGMCN